MSTNEPRELSTQRLETFTRLKTDLTYYAKHCLKIRDKSGKLIPFIFNRAQTYLHARLEEQRKKTGRVRAVLVKGRQLGSTTYVSARYFHRSTLTSGSRVFILAHIAESTHHIFKMVGAFFDAVPGPMKPAVKVSNQRNLEFEGIGSEYSIGTAGSADIGRGMTIQLFHGSESAYWPNTDALMSGVLQGVADLLGTEVIFESTANGMGNAFHALAMAGLKPDSDFITIFLPWFWSDEYRSPTPPGFCPTEEESKLMALYGLDEEQIYWRRKKINDAFGGKIWSFQREYPCTLSEAFITSGESLYSGELIAAARKNKTPDNAAPLILGVDPGRTGDDTGFCFRRGREVVRKKEYNDMDEMKIVGLIAQELDKGQVQMCFVDVGLGYGVVDRLRELGYGKWVRGIHFGEGALEPDIYLNKRTEMYDNARKWFEEGGANIPDDDAFAVGLLSIPPLKQTVGRGVLSLPPKDEIKKNMGAEQKQFLNMVDAFCFCAGTKIDVVGGQKNIEDIRVGDRVKTPYGTREVVLTHISAVKELTEVMFSDGKKLCGKGAHKVFSFLGGLVRLDMLYLTNEIETNHLTRKWIWKILNLCFTKDVNFGFKETASIIAPQTRVGRRHFYTDGCTPMFLVVFQKAMKSTIKILIDMIIELRIWSLWGKENTLNYTGSVGTPTQKIKPNSLNILKIFELKPQNGTGQRRDASGMLNTENIAGKKEKLQPGYAQYAGKNLKSFIPVNNIALLNVGKNNLTRNIKRNIKHVWNAVKNFILINIGLKPVVPVSVRTYVVEETNVYNLTLDRDNMYYANGVLVENCLTFAYPVASSAVENRIKRKEPEMLRTRSPLSTIKRVAKKPDMTTGFSQKISLF